MTTDRITQESCDCAPRDPCHTHRYKAMIGNSYGMQRRCKRRRLSGYVYCAMHNARYS